MLKRPSVCGVRGKGCGFFWRAARSSCLACRRSVELPQAVGARHVVFAYAFLVHPAACVERLEVCGVYAFARVVVPNPQGCRPQACSELYGAVEILVAALLPVVCHLHVVAVEFLAVWAVERLVAALHARVGQEYDRFAPVAGTYYHG